MLIAVLVASAVALLIPRRGQSLGLAKRPAGKTAGGGLSLPMMASLGLAAGAYVFVPSPYDVVVAPVVFLAVHRVVARLEPTSLRRRREQLEAQFPQVVDLLGAALSAGADPSTALGGVASVVDEPMRAELTGIAAQLRLGADPSTTWSAMSAHPQLGPLGRTLIRATEVGAPVHESLGRLADELRATRRSRVMAKARSVETKAAIPLALFLLPAFMLIGIVPIVATQLSGFGLF